MDRVVRKKQKRNKKARVSLDKDKEIIRIKKRNRFEMIKKNIYSLPLEIKIKIYQMSNPMQLLKQVYPYLHGRVKQKKNTGGVLNNPLRENKIGKQICF